MNAKQYLNNPGLGVYRMKEWVLDKGVQISLVKGQKEYQPFVILGYYRTGSNYLQSLLNSMPSVVTYSEVFFNDKIFWANGVYGHEIEDPALLADRLENPVKFLEDHLYRKYASHVKAVGFKYLYPQFEDERFQSVAEYLKDHPDLKVIHLKRANFLRIRLSLEILLRQNKVAVATSEKSLGTRNPVHFEPADLLKQFESLERRVQSAEKFFENHPVMEVEYSEFEHEPDQVLVRLCDFLGVPYQKPFSPLKKLNKKPLSEALDNYEELKRAFANTKWAHFFED